MGSVLILVKTPYFEDIFGLKNPSKYIQLVFEKNYLTFINQYIEITSFSKCEKFSSSHNKNKQTKKHSIQKLNTAV